MLPPAQILLTRQLDASPFDLYIGPVPLSKTTQLDYNIIGQKTTTIIGQMDSVSAEEQKCPDRVLGHFATKAGFDFFLSSLSFV